MRRISVRWLPAARAGRRLLRVFAAVARARGGAALATALALSCFSGLGASELPAINSQPASPVKIDQGMALALEVRATDPAGSGALSFQWRVNNINMADGANISGSSGSNLLIRPAFTNNSGSYTVVVSNTIGAVTSAVSVVTVSPDTTPPKVAITSPASGTRTNFGAVLTFLGTASDNVEVTNVSFWITNLNGSYSAPLIQGQAALEAGPGSVSNWTAGGISAAAGSNIFVARSYDFSGNPSSLATLKFFVKATNWMTLATTGYGKVKGGSSIGGDAAPSTNGAWLNVGEAYSLTASPANRNYFSNFTGTTLTVFGTSNGTKLNFIMESNTAITANFFTNRFIGMAGIYNGLFTSSQIGTNTEETSGMISGLTLDTGGGYSATVLLGGSAKGISGGFTPEGNASNSVVITNGVPDGTVTVQLICDGTNVPRSIHGFVSGTNAIVLPDGTSTNGWMSEVALVASLTNTSNFPGAYTLLIPPAAGADGISAPAGFGYAMITNVLPSASSAAYFSFAGVLADWSTLATSMPVREDNQIPVYLNYFQTPQPGMLFGMLNLASNAPYIPTGNLTWIRKATGYGMFTNGFTNNYSTVAISPWSNSVPLGDIITANQLVLDGGGLAAPLTYSVTYNGTNLVLAENGGSTNNGSATVNTNTGRFTVVFTNDIHQTITGHGAILQNTSAAGLTNFGGGFYVIGSSSYPTNSGSIVLYNPIAVPVTTFRPAFRAAANLSQ
jgi:hypothetical protein